MCLFEVEVVFCQPTLSSSWLRLVVFCQCRFVASCPLLHQGLVFLRRILWCEVLSFYRWIKLISLIQRLRDKTSSKGFCFWACFFFFLSPMAFFVYFFLLRPLFWAQLVCEAFTIAFVFLWECSKRLNSCSEYEDTST